MYVFLDMEIYLEIELNIADVENKPDEINCLVVSNQSDTVFRSSTQSAWIRSPLFFVLQKKLANFFCVLIFIVICNIIILHKEKEFLTVQKIVVLVT